MDIIPCCTNGKDDMIVLFKLCFVDISFGRGTRDSDLPDAMTVKMARFAKIKIPEGLMRRFRKEKSHAKISHAHQ